MPGPRRQMHQQEHGLLLLLFTPVYQGLSSIIPPVTLATVTASVLIHFGFLDQYITAVIRSPSLENVCASYVHVWYEGDWPRLFLSTWFHYDDRLLYICMVSFLWKGVILERQFGSPYFAYLIMVFSVLTNGLLMALSVIYWLIDDERAFIDACYMSFIGVIFALKVLTTYYTANNDNSVASLVACWVELIVIPFVTTRGFIPLILAGIFAGMAYLYGPIKPIMDALWKPFASVLSGQPAPKTPPRNLEIKPSPYRARPFFIDPAHSRLRQEDVPIVGEEYLRDFRRQSMNCDSGSLQWRQQHVPNFEVFKIIK